MNRQEMLDMANERPSEPRPRIQFGRTEAWRDCHGMHRAVDIWYGGDVCGYIRGDTLYGASSAYVVRIAGKFVGPTHYTMRDAKTWVRANVFRTHKP